jgi:hypothetical protein
VEFGHFRQNSSAISRPPLATRISSRRLVVRVGTSKGSTISQHGCSTSGALATGALQKQEEIISVVLLPKTQQLYVTYKLLLCYKLNTSANYFPYLQVFLCFMTSGKISVYVFPFPDPFSTLPLSHAQHIQCSQARQILTDAVHTGRSNSV